MTEVATVLLVLWATHWNSCIMHGGEARVCCSCINRVFVSEGDVSWTWKLFSIKPSLQAVARKSWLTIYSAHTGQLPQNVFEKVMPASNFDAWTWKFEKMIFLRENKFFSWMELNLLLVSCIVCNVAWAYIFIIKFMWAHVFRIVSIGLFYVCDAQILFCYRWFAFFFEYWFSDEARIDYCLFDAHAFVFATLLC